MRIAKIVAAFLLLTLFTVTGALAADLQGKVADRTGGVLAGAVVRLLNVATGREVQTTADTSGHFRFADLTAGAYRVVAVAAGFSESARTLVIEKTASSITLDFDLEIGALKTEVAVTADRGARDTQVVPLRVDRLSSDALHALTPTSTGDALAAAPGVTLVGSGPFQVRPRLRGLDSTRVLVLVDGERLNNARTATDRAGVEVGLVDVSSIDAVEVLGGAGSVLYGTDALAGTINLMTNRPRFSAQPRVAAGFDGFYSSNENGRRGTVTLGASAQRWAVSFVGGAERFDDYRAGKDFGESSVPFFANGTLKQADTIDTNFGFTFKKFPEAFNAPFTRTSATVASSGASGSSANLSGLFQINSSQQLEVKYLRRNAEDVGFPDFQQPYFFQSITLPWSRLDKFSAAYTFSGVAPWLPKLTVKSYYQRQDRLLRNVFPVQFPAPTATTFFPISVFRLDIQSDTRQQVWTPGVDVQATFLTRPNNLLTGGLTWFSDRSEDARTTVTQMSMLGVVALGQFGPAATVFPTPTALGPPTTEFPVRVPNASFRDLGLFVHDEWNAARNVRVTTGVRVDGYRVATDATPGYDIEKLIAGAVPAIDRATLPNVTGDRITRTALTGEAGVVLWADKPVSVFTHYVHSYRHPNLEELLFSGPATAGNIVPNIQVKPETGHNVDVGARYRARFAKGSIAYFNNTYAGFISTEEVAIATAGSISQAINLAKVRIQGVEGLVEAPIVAAGLLWSPSATVSFNRGTVLSGTSPRSGLSLDGKPQDNITPWKITANLRVSDRAARWWASYGVRTETDVTRVSPLLTSSSFLIAQDLMALDGFAIHRVAAGYDWRRANGRLGLVFAVDNLMDTFYREQFQFAPARGRTFSVSVKVGQ